MAEICTVTRVWRSYQCCSWSLFSNRTAWLLLSQVRRTQEVTLLLCGGAPKGTEVQMPTEATTLIQSRLIRSDSAVVHSSPFERPHRRRENPDAPWISSLFKLVDQDKKGLFPFLNPPTCLSGGLHVCVKSTAQQEQSGAAVHVLFFPSRRGSIF